jgi:hypothetical protein
MMITTTLLLHDVSCCLSREHGRWSWHLVQPCVNEYPDRTPGLPCSTLAGGYLPLRSSGCYQEDLEARELPIGFLVSVSPVRGSFSSCRPATQRIASYVLLYENQVSPSWKYGSMEMRGGWKTPKLSRPFSCRRLRGKNEKM